MRTRFLHSLFLFVIILSVHFLSGCIGASIVDDPTESQDETVSLDSPGNSLPGPFDTSPGGPEGTQHADAGEPSVFSTQVGDGHTPERPEDLCEVDIWFPLNWVDAHHDFQCPFPQSLISPTPPRVTLKSLDPNFDPFQETFDAICDNKGWEFWVTGEFWFFYSYSLSVQIPRHLEFKVETLVSGNWVEAAVYSLEVFCPWPPPPPCFSDGC